MNRRKIKRIYKDNRSTFWLVASIFFISILIIILSILIIKQIVNCNTNNNPNTNNYIYNPLPESAISQDTMGATSAITVIDENNSSTTTTATTTDATTSIPQTIEKDDSIISKITQAIKDEIAKATINNSPSSTGISEDYFGDGFSSDVYINSNKTNFFFDDIVTAYTFEPKYNLQDATVSSGSQGTPLALKNNYCLAGNCLSLINKNLYFNNKAVKLPTELAQLVKENKVANLSIGSLDTKWLVGAVIGRDGDNYGLVYYFDGQNFKELISLGTENRIKPAYNRSGGTIGFGGSDSDFLVLYSGYDGIAYHIQEINGQETITNVSEFFGLRVNDGGFTPQIITVGKGQDRTWFVCGQGANSFKFIKLWQNGSNDIVGALDFEDLLSEIPKKSDNFSCFVDSNTNNILLTSYSLKLKLTTQWRFLDQGFDNGHDYIITSKNLNNSGKSVKGVIVKDLIFNGNYKLSASNNGTDWLSIIKNQKSNFLSTGTGLYWKLETSKGETNNYSPYFGGISPVTYYLSK